MVFIGSMAVCGLGLGGTGVLKRWLCQGRILHWLCVYTMGSCPNYGPFSGTLNNRCRIIIGTQKVTIILTTTHIVAVLTRNLDPSACLISGAKGPGFLGLAYSRVG